LIITQKGQGTFKQARFDNRNIGPSNFGYFPNVQQAKLQAYSIHGHDIDLLL